MELKSDILGLNCCTVLGQFHYVPKHFKKKQNGGTWNKTSHSTPLTHHCIHYLEGKFRMLEACYNCKNT